MRLVAYLLALCLPIADVLQAIDGSCPVDRSFREQVTAHNNRVYDLQHPEGAAERRAARRAQNAERRAEMERWADRDWNRLIAAFEAGKRKEVAG